MHWPPTQSLFLRLPDSRPIREIEQEILDELDFHLVMRTLDNVATGMAADDARQDAQRRFGDIAQVRKTCRQIQLGERIMLQRIQAVLTVALLGAVVFLGVQSYRSQRANQEAAGRMMEVLDSVVGPSVVQTTPRTGDTQVDPSIGEIRVTYNRKMLDGSWSWCYHEGSFRTTGKPHYEADKKTCVLPVELEPGKVYTISLNTPTYQNFRDATGRPAIPYMLQFSTRK